MTPLATTTEIITLATTFISTWGPQMLLILVGILGSLVIWVLAKRGIYKVFGSIKKF